jgi:maltose alpha-D-glucosyltransferase/alpha-amylase
MDAVPFVIATKGAKVRTPVEQYDMLRLFQEFLQRREGDAVILAEANVLPETDMKYFGRDGDRMQNDAQFPRQPTFVRCAGVGGLPSARQGAQCHQTTAGHRAMGPVPAQPR